MEEDQSRPDRERGRLVRTDAAFALVLAVVAWILLGCASIVFWLVSFAIGVLVLRTIRRNRLPRKGYVTAWMAMLISGAGILSFVFIVATIPHQSRPSPGSNCSNNLHQLGLAISNYEFDHHDKFPDPDNWPQQTIGYVKTQGIFICSARTNRGLRRYPVKLGEMESLSVTYAMNERLRGLSVRDVKKPEETVLLFESSGGELSGGPELLPKEMRHEERKYLVIHHRYINVLFVDGHVNKVPLEQVPLLKWDPK